MAIGKMQINYDKCLFFDIETSKIKCDNGDLIQVTYICNLLTIDCVAQQITDSKYFRTIGDAISYMNVISQSEQLICYCHNLDYELFHILRDTQSNGINTDKIDIYNMPMGQSIFRDKNAPLSIFLDAIPNINFKDSYALFNKSVKKLGEEINLPKLDYDYKVTRTPHDDMTELDYKYNERDNEIVARSLIKRWNERGETLKTTPLTFTASTKKDRYDFIKKHFGEKELKRLNRDSSNVYVDFNFYKMQTDAYQGGLTTANKNYFNKAIKDKVMSIDITSSYPYQLCARRFPIFEVGTTNHFEGDDADQFYSEILHGLSYEQLPKETPIKGYYATVTITNLEIKNDNYLLPLSSSSTTYIENEIVVNGKVHKADKIIMTVDNVTLSWLNMCYYYDDIIVSELVTTTKDRYLRQGEVSFLFNNFRIKQTMKGVPNMEYDYALAKSGINNNYGIKVQKPLKDRFDIVEGEIIKMEYKDEYLFTISPEDIYNNFIDLKEENKYKNMCSKNFDIFSDGVFVTAYARYMLIEMMIKLTEKGCICVYTDTDSLKFICNDIKTIQNFVNEINDGIISNNKSMYRFEEYRIKFNVNDEDYEEVCKLGTWDIENDINENGQVICYKYFKTLGAKKYAYISEDGIHTTIAGCSKKIKNTITLYSELNELSLVDALDECFSPGTMFDATCSGRTVSHRDNRDINYLQTLRYKGLPLYSNGGIIIEDTSYTLNLSKSDEDVLEIRRESDIIRTLNAKGELIYND